MPCFLACFVFRPCVFNNQNTFQAREVFERFCKNLDDIEAKIIARNKGLKVPYTILLPSKIPAGIAV